MASNRDRDNIEMGNTKLHWIKGAKTACGRKVPLRVQRGWHVQEFGFASPRSDINCKQCRAAIAKATQGA